MTEEIKVHATNAQKLYAEMASTAENSMWSGYVKDLESVPYPSQVIAKLIERGCIQRIAIGNFQTPSEYRLITYPENGYGSMARIKGAKSADGNVVALAAKVASLEKNMVTVIDQLNRVLEKVKALGISEDESEFDEIQDKFWEEEVEG